MERLRRTGSVIVDQQKTDFSTPGTSANLDIGRIFFFKFEPGFTESPVYIGGPPDANIVFPSPVWTINLRKGFSGCIKNVRFNGLSAKIATVLENSNATGMTFVLLLAEIIGVSLGCPVQHQNSKCLPNPCQNYGICVEGLLSFTCDCSATNKEGPLCNIGTCAQ